jgi:hypothetical protein
LEQRVLDPRDAATDLVDLRIQSNFVKNAVEEQHQVVGSNIPAVNSAIAANRIEAPSYLSLQQTLLELSCEEIYYYTAFVLDDHFYWGAILS